MTYKTMTSIGNFIEFSRGGGWGKETPAEGYVRTAIIRGADFPAIQNGSYSELPVRFEKQSKVDSVRLHAGDIVLENSGGTSTRPTGRTVLITQELIDNFDCPVIPASFCRILRFKSSIDNIYAYYWLQDMYHSGRTWSYQNRSTGLSNFQYKVFSANELIPSISIDEQHRISNVLFSLDSKRIANHRLNGYLERVCQTLFNQIAMDKSNNLVPVGTIANVNPRRTLARGKFARCIDMASLSTSGSFPSGWTYKNYGGGMKFQNGDTILARITPCLENGKTGYINFLDEGEVAFGSTEYIVLSTAGELPPEYFYFLARNPDFVAYAVSHMNGSSGRQRVSASDIEAYEVRVPSHAQLETFSRVSSSSMRMIRSLSLENRKLNSLRDTLLPKLISGEIDVSNVNLPTLSNSHLS